MSEGHDQKILNSIFNPFLPIGEPFYDEDLFVESQEVEEEMTPSVVTAKRMEAEGVKAAEMGDFESAEKFFSEAIKAANRASSYNNRAQLLRLKGDDVGAMVDLDKAIEISCGKGKASCQAFCQKGLLHRRYGRENEARECFTQAAKLGSPFAKNQVSIIFQQLVAMNPYAALCSQMLNNMMTKLNQLENTASEEAVNSQQ